MIFTPINTAIAQAQRRPSVQAFERFLGDVVKTAGAHTQFKEHELGYLLQIDVPGVAKEHLLIKVEDQVVRLETSPEAARKYNLSYELPVAIDPTSSQAKLELGVLSLELSKRKPVDRAAILNIQ
jgi:HSP20 family molecular chaperone IbpA